MDNFTSAVGNGFRDNTIKGLAVSTTSTAMSYYVRLEKARTLLEIKYTK